MEGFFWVTKHTQAHTMIHRDYIKKLNVINNLDFHFFLLMAVETMFPINKNKTRTHKLEIHNMEMTNQHACDGNSNGIIF